MIHKKSAANAQALQAGNATRAAVLSPQNIKLFLKKRPAKIFGILLLSLTAVILYTPRYGVISASSASPESANNDAELASGTNEAGSGSSSSTTQAETSVLGTSNPPPATAISSDKPKKADSVTAVSAGTSSKLPSSILDLTNWKLTLPTGPVNKATEIKQPQLAAFSENPWFMANAAGDGVIFRAPVACTAANTGPACGSKTSLNTTYARSELREMTGGGSANAAWSMVSGTHTLEVNLAFMKLPSVKPQLVGAQIHDGSNDITVIRLDGKKLYVTQGNNSRFKLITDNYNLGTRATIKYVASGGQVQVFYNGAFVATVPSVTTGNFFKTGAYTQANCDNSAPCDGNVNYGEVQVYSVKVTHE